MPQKTLRLQEQYLEPMTTFLDRAEEVFLACGTSYHACLAVSYMFSKLAFLATHPVIASEFVERYGRSVLAAVEHARLRAAIILGLTNVVGSTLTRSPASTSANNQAGDRGRGHQDLHLPALGARPTRLEACQEEEEDLP